MKAKILIGVAFAPFPISPVLVQTDIPDVSVTIFGDNAIPAVFPGNIIETTSKE